MLYPKFVNGDVRCLPFKDNIFNGYISIGVIEHLKKEADIEKVFIEAYRVLKPGGVAYFVVPNLWQVIKQSFIKRILPRYHLFHAYIPNKHLLRYSQLAGFNILDNGTFNSWETLYTLVMNILGQWGKENWFIKHLMNNAFYFLDNFRPFSSICGYLYVVCLKPRFNKQVNYYAATKRRN
jgi:ubiquinone/menaquinone biosynthesis C-methylase UbiE